MEMKNERTGSTAYDAKSSQLTVDGMLKCPVQKLRSTSTADI